jgi:hypothetical protein
MKLLTSHCNYKWLPNLFTGDGKWVTYVNHTRKRKWLRVEQSGIETPKKELHPRIVMWSTWWSVTGVIHLEVLPTSSTITTDLYWQQLDRVVAKLGEKQNKVCFSMTMPNLTLQIRHVKKYWSSDGLCFHICRILQTWLSLTTIYFVLLPMTWAKREMTKKTTSKWISATPLGKSPRSSTNEGFCLFQSVGDKSQIVPEHTLLNLSCIFVVKK